MWFTDSRKRRPPLVWLLPPNVLAHESRHSSCLATRSTPTTMRRSNTTASCMHFVAGAVVIDPHILHSSQQIGILEGFLRVLKIVPEIEVKIKASRVRGG
jgi:hypothetical protein